MKPRTVDVLLQLETDAPLRDLKSAQWWNELTLFAVNVQEARANVTGNSPRKPLDVKAKARQKAA